jgi:uncharacterized protein (TIGR02996 family)
MTVSRSKGELPADLLGLLRACKDAPEDHDRRCVLADWLEENGDPERAEYTRLSCALQWWGLGSVSRGEGDPEWTTMLAREGELRRRHGRRWLGLFATGSLRPGFRDGLISLTGPAHWIDSVQPSRLSPSLRAWMGHLTLKGPSSSAVRDLAGNDFLSLFCSLDLSGSGYDDDDFATLATSPHVANVRQLYVHLDSDAGLRALTESPYLRGVHSLYLGGPDLGSEGVRLLVDSPLLDNIRLLYLCVDAGPEGMAVLAASPRVARLESLTLEHNHTGDAGLKALADSPHLAGLRSLRVFEEGISLRG